MTLTKKEHILHSKTLLWWDNLSAEERIKIKEKYMNQEPINMCPKCGHDSMHEMGDNLSYCENCGEHTDTIFIKAKLCYFCGTDCEGIFNSLGTKEVTFPSTPTGKTTFVFCKECNSKINHYDQTRIRFGGGIGD